MSRELHIQPDLKAFIETAFDRVPVNTEIDTLSYECPCCGHPVLFPIVARERDVVVMERLLGIASQYLDDSGARTKMMAAVLAKCYIAKAKKG